LEDKRIPVRRQTHNKCKGIRLTRPHIPLRNLLLFRNRRKPIAEPSRLDSLEPSYGRFSKETLASVVLPCHGANTVRLARSAPVLGRSKAVSSAGRIIPQVHASCCARPAGTGAMRVAE